MTFRLKIKKHALKFIKELPKKDKQQLRILFEKLKLELIHYRDYDIVKLKGLKNSLLSNFLVASHRLCICRDK